MPVSRFKSAPQQHINLLQITAIPIASDVNTAPQSQE